MGGIPRVSLRAFYKEDDTIMDLWGKMDQWGEWIGGLLIEYWPLVLAIIVLGQCAERVNRHSEEKNRQKAEENRQVMRDWAQLPAAVQEGYRERARKRHESRSHYEMPVTEEDIEREAAREAWRDAGRG